MEISDMSESDFTLQSSIMKHIAAAILVALNFLFPVLAYAQDLKSPLSYSLREYGVILGIALLGGLAAWFRRVRKGEADMLNISALIGELAISAFAGLISFWICESFGLSPLVTAAVAGMAGHAGGNGITWLERLGKRYAEKRFGITGPAPLGDK